MARKRQRANGARARTRRAGSSSRRSITRALIGALAVVIALALSALGWLTIVYPMGAGPGSGRELRVEVTPGMNVDVLARVLGERGAIQQPRLFAIYARILGADDRLRDGTVLLTDDMSPRDVLQRVALGYGAATVRVTIPEGFHRFAIAQRLERWGVCGGDAFLEATEDRALLDELEIEGPSAEGYLFPDTYRFPQDLDAREVVRRLVANWQRRAAPIYEERADALRALEEELSWGRHEALILASIVEREAVERDERPVIARVFMNRMSDPAFRPKRLQADPTVSYGCLAAPDAAPSCAGFDGRHITRAMLGDVQNAYNTYRHEGLPPGPICNPGVDSMRAVLSGEQNGFLYFVARGHGRHTFSATLDAHNDAVARFRDGANP